MFNNLVESSNSLYGTHLSHMPGRMQGMLVLMAVTKDFSYCIHLIYCVVSNSVNKFTRLLTESMRQSTAIAFPTHVTHEERGAAVQFGNAFHACDSVLTITTTLPPVCDMGDRNIATQEDYHNEILRLVGLIVPPIEPSSFHTEIGIQPFGCILSQCERIGFDNPIIAREFHNAVTEYGVYAMRVFHHRPLLIQTIVEQSSTMFIVGVCIYNFHSNFGLFSLV